MTRLTKLSQPKWPASSRPSIVEWSTIQKSLSVKSKKASHWSKRRLMLPVERKNDEKLTTITCF